jgi:hypothetical protein
MHAMKGLAAWAIAARAAGVPEDPEVNTFINGSVFATLTNGEAPGGPARHTHTHTPPPPPSRGLLRLGGAAAAVHAV